MNININQRVMRVNTISVKPSSIANIRKTV